MQNIVQRKRFLTANFLLLFSSLRKRRRQLFRELLFSFFLWHAPDARNCCAKQSMLIFYWFPTDPSRFEVARWTYLFVSRRMKVHFLRAASFYIFGTWAFDKNWFRSLALVATFTAFSPIRKRLVFSQTGALRSCRATYCEYKARPRRACACLPSRPAELSSENAVELWKTSSLVIKHATIVSLFTFCNRMTAPDWSRASSETRESDLPLSDQQRKLSALRFSIKIALQQLNWSFCRNHTRQVKVKSTETPRIDILKNTRSCVVQRERLHPPYRLLTAGVCRSLITPTTCSWIARKIQKQRRRKHKTPCKHLFMFLFQHPHLSMFSLCRRSACILAVCIWSTKASRRLTSLTFDFATTRA